VVGLQGIRVFPVSEGHNLIHRGCLTIHLLRVVSDLQYVLHLLVPYTACNMYTFCTREMGLTTAEATQFIHNYHTSYRHLLDATFALQEFGLEIARGGEP
jgi:hypothetical protein